MKILAVDPFKDHFLYVVTDEGKEVVRGRRPTMESISDIQAEYEILSKNVLIDAGFLAGPVYALCEEHGFIPTKGQIKHSSQWSHKRTVFFIDCRNVLKSDDPYDDCLRMAKEYGA
jgi:hypothetical protein